jgi:hypothetical protein
LRLPASTRSTAACRRTRGDDWFVRFRTIWTEDRRSCIGPVNPVCAARAAIAVYHAQQPAWDTFRVALPVRTRAPADLQHSRRVS